MISFDQKVVKPRSKETLKKIVEKFNDFKRQQDMIMESENILCNDGIKEKIRNKLREIR